jgi:DeoR/GlpR family transcriptional regulator of sugar metabolism
MQKSGRPERKSETSCDELEERGIMNNVNDFSSMADPAQTGRDDSLSAAERRSLIAQMVLERGKVLLSDLVEQFGITETSIRRDLVILESQGQLKRFHGGAISLSGNSRSDSYSEKMQLHIKAKQRIGKAAAEMIKAHDVVLFDSGSTTLQIIKQIPAELRLGTSITMVTNSVAISQEVLGWPSPNLIILGGIYLPDYQATAGPQTLNQLQDLTADCVFLGADGLTMSGGATTADILMAEVDRLMVDRSRRAVLVADSSKFGRIGFVPVKPLTVFQTIITDVDAPEDVVTALRGEGVEVILV